MDDIKQKLWYELTPDEVLVLLESDSVRGLSSEESLRRKEHFGPNIITSKKEKGYYLFSLSISSTTLVTYMVRAQE